jgi:hypothetical protein
LTFGNLLPTFFKHIFTGREAARFRLSCYAVRQLRSLGDALANECRAPLRNERAVMLSRQPHLREQKSRRMKVG